MGSKKIVGRVGTLALFSGVGVALMGAAPAQAAPVDNLKPNISVSANGKTVVHSGSATANSSGAGSIAVAVGRDSVANATDGANNRAVVVGRQSVADAGFGNSNTAVIFGNGNEASATNGSGNRATVMGNQSKARASFGNDNTASTQGNGSSSQTGCVAAGAVCSANTVIVRGNGTTAFTLGDSLTASNGNNVKVTGDNSLAEVGGSGNKVTVTGDSSGGFIALGSGNTLTVSGDHLAGNIPTDSGVTVTCVTAGTPGCTFNP